jgi:hypothetical protein
MGHPSDNDWNVNTPAQVEPGRGTLEGEFKAGDLRGPEGPLF